MIDESQDKDDAQRPVLLATDHVESLRYESPPDRIVGYRPVNVVGVVVLLGGALSAGFVFLVSMSWPKRS